MKTKTTKRIPGLGTIRVNDGKIDTVNLTVERSRAAGYSGRAESHLDGPALDKAQAKLRAEVRALGELSPFGVEVHAKVRANKANRCWLAGVIQSA